MMHLNRGATSLGIFSEEEVREGLRSGRFVPSDMEWREGMANWQPLSQFSEFAPSGGCRAAATGYCFADASVPPGAPLVVLGLR